MKITASNRWLCKSAASAGIDRVTVIADDMKAPAAEPARLPVR
jgi:hypothetical protein